MLTMRQEQVDTFQQNALKQFEDEMVEHLKGFSPQLCKTAGEPAVRRVIRLGIANAERYGLADRGPVRLYIEMMFTFGVDFDTDPLLPWARTALSDQTVHQKIRSERLHSCCQDYITKAFGIDSEGAVAALERTRTVTLDSFRSTGGDFDGKILSVLRAVYPTKCEYVGQGALDLLLEKGKVAAADIGVATELVVAVIIGVMFAFGHGVLSDPLYPWVNSTLRDEHLRDPDLRAQRLFKKLNTYFDYVIQEIQ